MANLLLFEDKVPTKENILPSSWNFSESGVFPTIAGVSVFDDSRAYYGQYSLKVTSSNFDDPDDPTTIIPDEKYKFTAPITGFYYFSFYLMATQDYDYEEFTMNVYPYKNDVQGTALTVQPMTDDSFRQDGWNRYAFQFLLNEGDEWTFQIQFVGYESSSENVVSWWLDGFKLEYIEAPTSYPTFYTPVVEKETGWASYTDGVRTSVSPLVINSGVTSTLTNAASTSIETYLPDYVVALYNAIGNKFTPKSIGDYYEITVRFNAKNSNASGVFDFGLDVGGSVGVICKRTFIFNKGADTEQSFDINFGLNAFSEFVSNGGVVKITSVTGNTSIYDIEYQISRTHKA